MEDMSLNSACPLADHQVVLEDPQANYYYWPILSFDAFPRRQYHFHHQFKDKCTKSNQGENNFFKGLKWSSDGSCFLTSSDDNTLHTFDLPSDAADDISEVNLTKFPEDSFRASLTVQEGEAVYDYCWYPKMMASDPGSCVFATTTRDHPIHLWDAMTGKVRFRGVQYLNSNLTELLQGHDSSRKIHESTLCRDWESLFAQLRCTYRAFDAMDEITSAYSMCFNPAGAKLYCGYKKMLRVFDTSCPGREFSQHSTLTNAKDGQTGIISCLAFNPSNEKLLAAGSYSRTTAIYSEDSLELLFVLHGHQGGVTQVMFSKDGNFLYTGARKDPDILCWDIRNAVSTVYRLPRVTAETNQRIFFDIEPNGGKLGTGGQDGLVHMYDLQTGVWVNSFQAALDTVNSFSFHPLLPLAASASGHRRFKLSADSEDYEDGGGSLVSCLKGRRSNWMPLGAVEENCASVWRFPCSWVCSQSSSYEEKLYATVQADGEDQFSTPNDGVYGTDRQQLD